MEEADTLCDRIGIMARGRLRCLGTQQHLKSAFGSEAAKLRDETAFAAGLVFAVHPIHTEPVCCLVGRADLLCAAFSLAAMMHYQQAARRHTTIIVSLVATLICIGCAALSKETGITLVGACAGYDLLIVLGVGPWLRWIVGRAMLISSRLVLGRDIVRFLVSTAAESMRVPVSMGRSHPQSLVSHQTTPH